MHKCNKTSSYIQSILFLICFIIFTITSSPINTIKDLSLTIISNIVPQSESQKKQPESFSDLNVDYIEHNKNKMNWIDIAGLVEKISNNRALFNSDNIYYGKDYYINSRYDETLTDYEYNQIITLKEYLDSHSVNLLYVSNLTKYNNDSEFENKYGVETYLNRNADKLINRLKESNVDVLDLREKAVNENIDNKKSFYYGDHHYNTTTGLWAANKIVEQLNNDFAYNLDISKYNLNNFNRYELPNSWLGEQSKKLGITNSKFDNYTLLHPNYDTDYNIDFYNVAKSEGTFDIFINYNILNYPIKETDYASYHYIYLAESNTGIYITNKLAKDKHVLLLCDSFSHTIAPFLSLDISELDIIDPRYYNEAIALSSYLDNSIELYDTVIICYSPTMIGAHNNAKSFNYGAFHFFDNIK